MMRRVLFIGAVTAVVAATAATVLAEPDRKDEPRRDAAGGLFDRPAERKGDADRPDARREGDKPKTEARREGDKPKTEARREGDKPKPEARPAGEKPKPEAKREGEKPKPKAKGEGVKPKPDPSWEGTKGKPGPDVQAIAEQLRFQRGLLEVLGDPAMASQIAIIKIKELAERTREVGPALEALERIANSDVPPPVRNSALLTRAELLEKAGRVSEAYEALAQIAASKPPGDEVAAQARHVNRWLSEHPDMAERIIQNFRQTHRGPAPANPAPPGSPLMPPRPMMHARPGMPAPGQPQMMHRANCPCPMCQTRRAPSGEPGGCPMMQGRPGAGPIMPGGCPMMQGKPGAGPIMPGGCPMMQGKPGAGPIMPGGCPMMQGKPGAGPGACPMMQGKPGAGPGACPMMQGKPGAAPAHVAPSAEHKPPHAEGMSIQVLPDSHVRTWVMSSAAEGKSDGESISVQVQARPQPPRESVARPLPVKPETAPGDRLRLEVLPPKPGEDVRGWVTIQRPGQEPVRRPLAGSSVIVRKRSGGESAEPARPPGDRTESEICEALERQLEQLSDFADRLERRSRELNERAEQIERRGNELRRWAKELDDREHRREQRDDEEDD